MRGTSPVCGEWFVVSGESIRAADRLSIPCVTQRGRLRFTAPIHEPLTTNHSPLSEVSP